MATWKIQNNDAVRWANDYDGPLFHALLTDAPYHLQSIVKRYSKPDAKTENSIKKYGTQGVSPFMRGARGFMGTQWDGGDVAFRPETWDAFKKVLYPGAFGMAFSASRNWHRMAVAIEDSGFIIHPTMFFLWVQGQGFPKATKIRDEKFKGHKYGLQALKPAVEPVIVFQKPYEGRPIDNILGTGAGALNIDGGRIPLEAEDEYIINAFDDGAKPFGNGAGHKYTSRKQLIGRYPANLVLDNSIEFEKSNFFYKVSTQLDESDPFYYCAKVSPKERNAGLEEMPDTLGGSLDGGNDKGNGKDKPQLHPTKNNHPTLKPIELNKYLASLLLPPSEYSPRRLFVPFSGVASEMIGGLLAGWDEVVGVEFDTENGYVGIAEKRLEYWCRNI